MLPLPSEDTRLPIYWSRSANPDDPNHYPVRVPNLRSRSNKVEIWYVGLFGRQGEAFSDTVFKSEADIVDWDTGESRGYENTSNQEVIRALDAIAQEKQDEQGEDSDPEPAPKRSKGLQKLGTKQKANLTACQAEVRATDEDYSERGELTSPDIDSDDERYQDVSYYPDRWLVDDMDGVYEQEKDKEARRKANRRRGRLEMDDSNDEAEEEEDEIVLPHQIEQLLSPDPSKGKQVPKAYIQDLIGFLRPGNQVQRKAGGGMNQNYWEYLSWDYVDFDCTPIRPRKMKCGACCELRWCNYTISGRCPEDGTKTVSIMVGEECQKKFVMARKLKRFYYKNVPVGVSDPNEWEQLWNDYETVMEDARTYPDRFNQE